MIKILKFLVLLSTLACSPEIGGRTVPEYQVEVCMKRETVQHLLAGGFYLYGFKAVRSTGKAGRPVVWFRTQDYSHYTLINWPSQLSVFTSHSKIKEGTRILELYNMDIELGQTWKINSSGQGTLLEKGAREAVSIFDASGTSFTVGTARRVREKEPAAPVCAFPLYGGFETAFQPVEKILLMFSTSQTPPGTVIEGTFDPIASVSPGLLMEMPHSPPTRRTVCFDLKKKWSWGGGAWAQNVSPDQDLVPLLMESGS